MKSLGIFKSLEEVKIFISQNYPHVIIKAEPLVGVISGLPLQEEQEGAGEGGKKPGRKELKESEYHAKPKEEERQKPIEELSKPTINPASISRMFIKQLKNNKWGVFYNE